MASSTGGEQAKKRRKGRRKRLNTSSAVYVFRFEPTDNDWRQIQSAARVEFSNDQRQKICEIIDHYFRWLPFEQNAPFADDAYKRLRAIERTAREFSNELNRQPEIYASVRDAYHAAESAICRHFRTHDSDARRRDAFETLVKDMAEFVAACHLAQTELAKDEVAGFEEGESWEKLVRSLAQFAGTVGLNATTRKDSDKSIFASPFVSFFKALQERFPPDFQRYHPPPGSEPPYPGLSKALSDALEDMRVRPVRRRDVKSGTRRS